MRPLLCQARDRKAAVQPANLVRVNALVLSGGGMFGAYQAGAWATLSGGFQPDLVTGVSIGALNGYLIASGIRPDALIERWLALDRFSRLRWRARLNPLEGFVDATGLETLLQTLTAEFTPRIPLVVLATEIFPPRSRAFGPGGITWSHLAASCAVLGALPQYRIGGKRHSDGGLLCGMPIQAAVANGATRIVAINCLPRMPLAVRGALRLLRAVSRRRNRGGKRVDVVTVSPSRPLGSLRD